MEFDGEDPNLVEIIEAVGEVAIASHSGRLKAQEKEENEWYIDLLVKRYFSLYDNEIPSRSLFTQAINWYVKENLGEGSFKLAKQIKSIMRKLVLGPYDKYIKQYPKKNLSPAFG